MFRYPTLLNPTLLYDINSTSFNMLHMFDHSVERKIMNQFSIVELRFFFLHMHVFNLVARGSLTNLILFFTPENKRNVV